MEHDEPEFHIIQLHPRDTGGSLLEIDLQVGGEDMNGPWMPAGRDWQRAVHTDVVRTVAAAELQSPEPEALAARWSEIVQLPVEQDTNGLPSLRLDNATLRFCRTPMVVEKDLVVLIFGWRIAREYSTRRSVVAAVLTMMLFTLAASAFVCSMRSRVKRTESL